MKANISKLALIVSITVVATIMMFNTVTAESPGNRSIKGVYVATGGATCFLAVCGFDNLVPINGVYDLMTSSIEAVYTFNHNGKGKISRICPTVTHNGNPQIPYPYAWNSEDSWEFTYEVKADGSIALIQVPGSHNGVMTSGPRAGTPYKNEGRNRTGTISPDHKTIVLNGGLPDIVTFDPPELGGCGVSQMVCNSFETLIRQNK